MEQLCVKIILKGETIKEYLGSKREIIFNSNKSNKSMDFIKMDLVNKYSKIKDDIKYRVILQNHHSTIYELNSHKIIYSINHTTD